MFSADGNPFYLPHLTYRLGNMAEVFGQRDQARTYYQQAEELFNKHDLPGIEAAQIALNRVKVSAQIFLCYAREDAEEVENLYQKLSDVGFKPWMDKKDIMPGERWRSSIRRAIRQSDFFLACLPANSVNKRGVLHKEIKYVLDIEQEMLEDDIYLNPVRLEDCEVRERLRDLQWVDLFEKDGWTRLVKAIRAEIERRMEVPGDEKPLPGA